MNTITPAEAANQLDVTLDTIETLAGQMMDDTDLVTEDGLITEDGLAIITDQLVSGAALDPLTDLDEAAATVTRLQTEADEARERRDAAIRAAVDAGHPKGKVAERAGISRVRMHRITG